MNETLLLREARLSFFAHIVCSVCGDKYLQHFTYAKMFDPTHGLYYRIELEWEPITRAQCLAGLIRPKLDWLDRMQLKILRWKSNRLKKKLNFVIAL